MKLLVCMVYGLLGVASGFPWYFYRNFRRMNVPRESPLYRNQNTDNSWINDGCNGWKRLFENQIEFTGATQHGYLCVKSHNLVKILSWCSEIYNGDGTWGDKLIFTATLVDRRISLISRCEIYDVTIRAKIDGGGSCDLMLMDGILACVDEEELLPDYKVLTVYPTVDYNRPRPKINYYICETIMGTYCPGPAKVASIAADEEFQTIICSGNHAIGPSC